MMETPQQKKGFAWQPLTPKGVSAFSQASLGRLWLVQFVFALGAAATCIWFLSTDWFPVIARAVSNLPEEAQIRNARLEWSAGSPCLLAENRFLAVAVDLKHEGEARSPAHVALEFGEKDLKIFSLLGYVRFRYPADGIVRLSRREAVPWWGAWTPPILGLIAAGLVLVLMSSWAVLSTVYCGPLWLLGFFANRDLSLRGSWRLAGAACLPGTLFLIGGFGLYGLGWLDLIGLFFVIASHLVIGWIFLWLSGLKIPLHPGAENLKRNPFANPGSGETQQPPPP